ncbi:hypothetical protein ACQ4PT_010900 [Festuca glaucescens]
MVSPASGLVLPPPPPGPPPPGAVRLERPWSRVVREGSEESTARGPSFSVPFAQPRAQAGALPRQAQPPAVPAARPCFLEFSDEMHHMEEQLKRAVVVTITGRRPVVDMAYAAALLHAEFGVGPRDMSIRPYSPEDFLVLCGEARLRDRMVARGLVHARGFSLTLRGWLRQLHATAVDLPYLVPVELTGMPGHAWNRRTADALMEGYSFVVDVAAPTSRRDDMSVFKIWVRALDAENLPPSRPLFVEEPERAVQARGRHQGPPANRRAKTLCYDVRIRRVAEAVVVDAALPPPPPPPPQHPPSSPSSRGGVDRHGDDAMGSPSSDSSSGPGGGGAGVSDAAGGGAADGERTASLGEQEDSLAEQIVVDGGGGDWRATPESPASVRIPNIAGADMGCCSSASAGQS